MGIYMHLELPFMRFAVWNQFVDFQIKSDFGDRFDNGASRKKKITSILVIRNNLI